MSAEDRDEGIHGPNRLLTPSAALDRFVPSGRSVAIGARCLQGFSIGSRFRPSGSARDGAGSPYGAGIHVPSPDQGPHDRECGGAGHHPGRGGITGRRASWSWRTLVDHDGGAPSVLPLAWVETYLYRQAEGTPGIAGTIRRRPALATCRPIDLPPYHRGIPTGPPEASGSHLPAEHPAAGSASLGRDCFGVRLSVPNRSLAASLLLRVACRLESSGSVGRRGEDLSARSWMPSRIPPRPRTQPIAFDPSPARGSRGPVSRERIDRRMRTCPLRRAASNPGESRWREATIDPREDDEESVGSREVRRDDLACSHVLVGSGRRLVASAWPWQSPGLAAGAGDDWPRGADPPSAAGMRIRWAIRTRSG